MYTIFHKLKYPKDAFVSLFLLFHDCSRCPPIITYHKNMLNLSVHCGTERLSMRIVVVGWCLWNNAVMNAVL